jgi:hypothetical protein
MHAKMIDFFFVQNVTTSSPQFLLFGAQFIDNRSECRKKVGELKGEIGAF